MVLILDHFWSLVTSFYLTPLDLFIIHVTLPTLYRFIPVHCLTTSCTHLPHMSLYTFGNYFLNWSVIAPLSPLFYQQSHLLSSFSLVFRQSLLPGFPSDTDLWFSSNWSLCCLLTEQKTLSSSLWRCFSSTLDLVFDSSLR